jgi:beta-lactamase regulating signal transducer with metallopeptidase domain
MTLSPLPASLVNRIGWLLIHSLWEFALIAIAMMVVLRMMRRRSSAARYRTSLAALAAIAMAPALTWPFVPRDGLQQGPVEAVRPMSRETVVEGPQLLASIDGGFDAPVPDAVQFAGDRPDSVPVSGAASTAPSASALDAAVSPWLRELVAVWCLGVLLFALRPVWGWYMLHRLRRVGVSAASESVTSALDRAAQQIGVRRKVRVLQSTLVKVPMVVGYLRPVVLLPLCAVTGLSSVEVTAILAHELAHVRRNDFVVNLLQTLLETVFFYHPAVWWLSSRIRREREHCCDELAAQSVGSRAVYGRALLALEELRGPSPVLSLGATGGSLVERIRRLAGVERDPELATGVGAVASLAAAVLSIVLLSGVGVRTVTHADDASPTEADAESTSENLSVANFSQLSEAEQLSYLRERLQEFRRRTNNFSASAAITAENREYDAEARRITNVVIMVATSNYYELRRIGQSYRVSHQTRRPRNEKSPPAIVGFDVETGQTRHFSTWTYSDGSERNVGSVSHQQEVDVTDFFLCQYLGGSASEGVSLEDLGTRFLGGYDGARVTRIDADESTVDVEFDSSMPWGAKARCVQTFDLSRDALLVGMQLTELDDSAEEPVEVRRYDLQWLDAVDVDGVWYPTVFQETAWSAESPDQVTSYEGRVVDIKLNRLTKEDLEVTFPVGTEVTESATERNIQFTRRYRIGPDGEQIRVLDF